MMNNDDFTGPVNIGNPNEFTMLELAQSVIDITNSKSNLVYLPLPADDPLQRQPDITLAKEKLNNWEPNIQLKEGLKHTVAYFDDLLKKDKNK
jgi:UDP-glucuronate decarboxylase